MNVLVLIPPSKVSKNVARDLIYGCWCKGKRIAGIEFPPLSLLTLATTLRDSGNDVKVIDAAALGWSIDDLQSKAQDFDSAIILTSTMTVNADAEILSNLKKANPSLLTIVFGAHSTFMPSHTLTKDGIDIAVQNEAEFACRDLLNAYENRKNWRTCLGISYKDNGKIVTNPPYPFMHNLDELPIPDRTMLPLNVNYFNPIVKRVPYTTMMTSRGCPGRCTFCSSPPFYGNSVRLRFAEKVLEELRIIKSLGYKEVFFRDEIFTASKERLEKICYGMIEEKMDLSWICSARVGSIDKEMMELMKEAGCHMVRLGVESGSQKILNNIKKGITVEKTRELFRWTHEVGMDTHAHLMIGNPGETKKTIQKTIELLYEIEPTIITCGICTPYPGTPLFELVKNARPEVGDGSQCDLSRLHTQSFYNEIFCDIPPAELSRSLRKIYRKFYIRPKYWWKWLRKINSVDEFRRVSLAGTQVFDFIFRGD